MTRSRRSLIEFEVCAESLEACLAARDGGADRIELCAGLSEGGITPSHGLIYEAVRQSRLPVHPILRPRGGDFVYSDAEFSLIRTEMQHARELGVSGFVAGLLTGQGEIDIERTKELVALAAPLEVTFHRAFDCVADLPRALEAVISTGCQRLLTSGGQPDVKAGAAMLKQLVAQAAGRIRVAVGGGLRLAHAAEVARITQARAFHGSVRQRIDSPNVCLPGDQHCYSYSVEPANVRALMNALETGLSGV